MYAPFLRGKNSLNFDSGKTASTFLTFRGFLEDPERIASTKLFSSVHELESLKA